jgi:ATP-dependent protease HslVU (ClpYQ) peptidase subunit
VARVAASWNGVANGNERGARVTCIVGAIAEKGRVVIGGDSAGVDGGEWMFMSLAKDPKVFQVGEFIIGCAGSARMGQLLRYGLKPPKHPKGMDEHQFMVTLFVNAIRDCLHEGGFEPKSSGEEKPTGERLDGEAMIGYRGRLFTIFDDFQVCEMARPFAATGCGAPIALGAMEVLKDTDHPAEEQVRMALEASERWSAAVRGPFTVIG